MALFDGLTKQVAVERRIDIASYVAAMKAMIAGTFWTGPTPRKDAQS
jgi:hypothetical protein